MESRMLYRKEIDVSMRNGILCARFNHLAHLLISLNERIPLHKEIEVSMCNGVLRIWRDHSTHLLISLDIEWFQLKPFDLGGPTWDT